MPKTPRLRIPRTHIRRIPKPLVRAVAMRFAPTAEHACLNQKERRAETDSGKLIRLSAAMHAAQRRLPGTVVRARLCRGTDGLVYVLTVLAHDGKVARISVDAMKGGSAADR